VQDKRLSSVKQFTPRRKIWNGRAAPSAHDLVGLAAVRVWNTRSAGQRGSLSRSGLTIRVSGLDRFRLPSSRIPAGRR
jgi:hypothetical protein